MTANDDQLLDFVDLEDEYYSEGYNQGLKDGQVAGVVEGKIFGIEKGFEKALEMGRLRGRAAVWKSRQANDSTDIASSPATSKEQEVGNRSSQPTVAEDGMQGMFPTDLPRLVTAFPANTRLSKHVDSLVSSFDLSSLSLQNDDDSSEDFELRLKRGASRFKVIAKSLGEPVTDEAPSKAGDNTGNIEDISSLSVRH